MAGALLPSPARHLPLMPFLPTRLVAWVKTLQQMFENHSWDKCDFHKSVTSGCSLAASLVLTALVKPEKDLEYHEMSGGIARGQVSGGTDYDNKQCQFREKPKCKGTIREQKQIRTLWQKGPQTPNPEL